MHISVHGWNSDSVFRSRHTRRPSKAILYARPSIIRFQPQLSLRASRPRPTLSSDPRLREAENDSVSDSCKFFFDRSVFSFDRRPNRDQLPSVVCVDHHHRATALRAGGFRSARRREADTTQNLRLVKNFFVRVSFSFRLAFIARGPEVTTRFLANLPRGARRPTSRSASPSGAAEGDSYHALECCQP